MANKDANSSLAISFTNECNWHWHRWHVRKNTGELLRVKQFIDLVFHHITHNVEGHQSEETCIDTRIHPHMGCEIVLYRDPRCSLCPTLRSYPVWCSKSPRRWICRKSDGSTHWQDTHTHTRHAQLIGQVSERTCSHNLLTACFHTLSLGYTQKYISMVTHGILCISD